MRKLLTGMLLVIGLPAFASVSDDLANNVSPAQAMKNAVKACAGNAGCEQAAVLEMLSAGISLDVTVAAATQAGAGNNNIAQGALASGQQAGAVTTAMLNAGTNQAAAANAVTFAAINLNLDQAEIQPQIADAIIGRTRGQSPATGGQGTTTRRVGTPVVVTPTTTDTVTVPEVPEPTPLDAGSPT